MLGKFVQHNSTCLSRWLNFHVTTLISCHQHYSIRKTSVQTIFRSKSQSSDLSQLASCTARVASNTVQHSPQSELLGSKNLRFRAVHTLDSDALHSRWESSIWTFHTFVIGKCNGFISTLAHIKHQDWRTCLVGMTVVRLAVLRTWIW